MLYEERSEVKVGWAGQPTQLITFYIKQGVKPQIVRIGSFLVCLKLEQNCFNYFTDFSTCALSVVKAPTRQQQGRI